MACVVFLRIFGGVVSKMQKMNVKGILQTTVITVKIHCFPVSTNVLWCRTWCRFVCCHLKLAEIIIWLTYWRSKTNIALKAAKYVHGTSCNCCKTCQNIYLPLSTDVLGYRIWWISYFPFKRDLDPLSDWVPDGQSQKAHSKRTGQGKD